MAMRNKELSLSDIMQAMVDVKASGESMTYTNVGKRLNVTAATIGRYVKEYELQADFTRVSKRTYTKEGWDVANSSGKGRFYFKGGNHTDFLEHSDTAKWDGSVLQLFCSAAVRECNTRNLKYELNKIFKVSKSIFVVDEHGSKIYFQYTAKPATFPSEKQMNEVYLLLKNLK